MDQYLLFAGQNYYPDGGWEDFKGAFTTLEEAKAEYQKWKGESPVWRDCVWAHVATIADGVVWTAV